MNLVPSAIRARTTLSAPADIVLGLHGVHTRKKVAGEITWYNMEKCLACGHTGFQCGVSEVRRGGLLIHSVKCFHPHDNPWGIENIDYGDFLASVGAISLADLEALRNNLRRRASDPRSSSLGQPALANMDALRTRQKRLKDNPAAQAWLAARGITQSAVAAFFLGLSPPYSFQGHDEPTADALVAPLMSSDGHPLKCFSYHDIPGVTLNPRARSWAAHANATYWATPKAGQSAVLVVEGLKDAWRVWEFLRQADALDKFCLITATHGSNLPNEWKRPEFWDGWEKIYLGQDADPAGERTVWKLRQAIGRPVYRLRPPTCPSHKDPSASGKDWTDWLQAGGSYHEFCALLESAELLRQTIDDDEGQSFGRLGFAPVDISCAYHKGRLYYTTQTLLRTMEMLKDPKTGEENATIVERLQTVVVRSDGEILTARIMPAPPGTPPDELVLRLSDGTLIGQRPKASSHNTWSWTSIQRFTECRQKGCSASTRHLTDMVRDAHRYLTRSVYLPYEDDYALLAFIVPVTYAQSIFQSLPQILVVGPPDSGKSTLGLAMSKLCANASVIGQSSAAAIARHIDETRGFVVLDDLESIARPGKDAVQATELLQALKLSYNKETAIKVWVDISKNNKVERLNFFGVKMINNTSGVDAILGSRMLRVQSGKIPDARRVSFLAEFDAQLAGSLPALRNDLHTWTFENVERIAEVYHTMFPRSADRANEITAPLRVIASLVDDSDLCAALDRALERGQRGEIDPEDPIDILREAASRLVLAGFREVSPTHLRMEMQTLVDSNFGRCHTNEIPEWARSDWIGRQLRALGITDAHSEGRRMRLWGSHLRVYPFSQWFLAEVLPDNVAPDKETQVDAFCAGCASCPYRNVGCPLMATRLSAEKSRVKQHH